MSLFSNSQGDNLHRDGQPSAERLPLTASEAAVQHGLKVYASLHAVRHQIQLEHAKSQAGVVLREMDNTSLETLNGLAQERAMQAFRSVVATESEVPAEQPTAAPQVGNSEVAPNLVPPTVKLNLDKESPSNTDELDADVIRAGLEKFYA